MKRYLNRVALGAAVVLTAAFGTSEAQAEYPEKPVTIVVGFSAGGGIDTYARTFAGFAQEEFGVPFVIVNQPGASGMIGAKATKEARSDGYTLMLVGGGTIFLKAKTDGDAAPATPDDFTPLGGIGNLTTSLMVPMESPFQTVNDVVAAAQADPGGLRWANPGNGSIHTMGGMSFLRENGIEAQSVPFKGGGAGRVAVVGEQVDFGFLGIQLISGFEEQLRALAVTAPNADPVYPDVPTMGDLGLPQLAVSNPVILYGKNDLPVDVVARLREGVARIASSPEYQEVIRKTGVEGTYYDLDEIAARMDALKATINPIFDELNN